jgi:ATP/maltotriose-dependent transcriptional regulator MalT
LAWARYGYQGRYEQAELYLQRGEALAKACFELIELLYGWRAQVKLYLALANPAQAIRVLDAAEDWLGQIVVPQFMRQHLSNSLRSTRATIRSMAAPPTNPSALSISQALIEPLSARELEVLALVSAGLSNSAIAHKLIVTVGTVKNTSTTSSASSASAAAPRRSAAHARWACCLAD